jgi:hypothetical protein
MQHRIYLILCLLVVVSIPALAGDDVPAWLRDAAAQKTDSYDKKVPAVVLVDESTMTVGEDGRVTTVSTFAIRILLREGREEAIAREMYETDSDKVKEMKAWLLRPGGSVKKYGKDETTDMAADSNDVYNEARYKMISAVDDAESGAVFGYQTVTESRTFFNQTQWYFQSNLPSLFSRVTVNVPAGWHASGTTFNHAEVKPVVNGTSYTWELRDLPFVEEEPRSPSFHSIIPRLAIAYGPDPGTAQSANVVTYNNWGDVSRWYSELTEPQVTLNDNIATKARELTASAKTELEKIDAVGRYVQNLKYISIQIGVGRFRPHAAAEVFAKSYGDCKDKANLMRAMLKALHITAYPVLIYSGDRTHVQQNWVSPSQFNHCIVAVQVGDETDAPTVIKHSELGRLLIFDATDDDTPVGDLPDHEQGSWALIAAGTKGSLVQMPVTPPEANRLVREANVELSGDGSIKSVISESSMGQAAVRERGALRHLSKPEYSHMIESWISQGATGAKLSKIEPVDEGAAGKFKLNVEFAVKGYAQLMQDRLLVFKPAIVSRSEALAFTDTKRKYPVNLTSRAFSETVRVKLPSGFDVDELPDPLKLETSFGSYSASYEVRDGQLVFTRAMIQKGGIIPVEEYSAVRNFYERIRATEQAPVVLAKK